MSSIKVGDLVIHKMSKVPIHDYKAYKGYNTLPGIVLELGKEKLLILWSSYVEWVDHSYLLKVGKAD